MQVNLTDALLVEAAVRGDSVAFGFLLERHYPALLRVCLGLVGEPTLAEDCAQDAAVVAWLRLNQLRSPELFSRWLKGIGRHRCLHALRTRASAPINDIELCKAEVCGSDLLIYSEVPHVVRGAIDDLPSGYRAAVRAFYFRGYGYAEAAADLGISVTALKARLHDARKILRYRFRLRDSPVRKSPRSLRTLAIHEAAHAVLYCRYDRELQRVSIAPVSAVWVGSGSREAPRADELPMVLELQVRMAGEIATLVGRAGLSGGDRDAAGEIALRETEGDQVEAALLLEHARRGARALLESGQIWAHVERLAAVLQSAGSVDGDEVRRLCSFPRTRQR